MKKIPKTNAYKNIMKENFMSMFKPIVGLIEIL